MVTEDGVYSVRCVQLGEYFLETIQFVALLVHEVTGEDNQVRLLMGSGLPCQLPMCMSDICTMR